MMVMAAQVEVAGTAARALYQMTHLMMIKVAEADRALYILKIL